jgi:hypothetical protein
MHTIKKIKHTNSVLKMLNRPHSFTQSLMEHENARGENTVYEKP